MSETHDPLAENPNLLGKPRQVIYVLARTDLVMTAGKLAVQVAHACATLIYNASLRLDFNKNEYFGDYDINWDVKDPLLYNLVDQGQTKVVLRAKSLAVLERAAKDCFEQNLHYVIIKDQGLTEFKQPTITCLGIGPIYPDYLPKYVRRLQLYTDDVLKEENMELRGHNEKLQLKIRQLEARVADLANEVGVTQRKDSDYEGIGF